MCLVRDSNTLDALQDQGKPFRICSRSWSELKNEQRRTRCRRQSISKLKTHGFCFHYPHIRTQEMAPHGIAPHMDARNHPAAPCTVGCCTVCTAAQHVTKHRQESEGSASDRRSGDWMRLQVDKGAERPSLASSSHDASAEVARGIRVCEQTAGRGSLTPSAHTRPDAYQVSTQLRTAGAR